MKRSRLIPAALFVGVGLALLLWREAAPALGPACDVALQAGDVVLLEGNTIRGRIVRLLNRQTEFSHVGVIDETNGRLVLLHADPDRGCVQEDWASIRRRDEYLSVLVLRPAQPSAARDAVSFCRERVRTHAPFNGSFRYVEGPGFYCTEFVLRAFDAGGLPLLQEIPPGATVFPERLLESTAFAVRFPLSRKR